MIRYLWLVPVAIVCGFALLLTGAAPRKSGDWTSYDGALTGNRHSILDQITTANVSALTMAWSLPISNPGDLEVTPLVVNGVMYVTGVNAVYAMDARTGGSIWTYSRPTSSGLVGDAAIGINRGVAVYNDRLFLATDNAHILALRLSDGHLLWETTMDPAVEQYGATAAPLVVKNKVISGVSGGDNGVRGFVAAYDVNTGQQVWRFYTVPAPGDPLASTWGGSDLTHACGATWMTGTYDNLSDQLFWTVGNPCPDYDGSNRTGDNLYTASVLALQPDTGQLRWYFQFTPHDQFDFDAQQTPMVVDTVFQGVQRKLLVQASRNGFFFVLDRTNGHFLQATPFVQKLTWATGVDASGRPIPAPGMQPTPAGTKICPASGGATNWESTAFNPATGYFYVMALEKCQTYSSTQGIIASDPGQKVLRAINVQTGAIAWEYPQTGSGDALGGVVSTAGGLVFFGSENGDFSAVNAKTGALLWTYPVGPYWHASPMTYSVNGKQYVAVAAITRLVVFALP